MDLSALIFVALAVAWAVYLVPKALRHHEEDAVGRSVDRFSDSMRVLARREAVSSREARFVVGSASPRTVEDLAAEGRAGSAADEEREAAEEAEEAGGADPAAEPAADPAGAAAVGATEPAGTPEERTTARPEEASAVVLPAAATVRRTKTARAARRRRRVLGLLLLANVVVAALAIGGVVAWAWIAAPASLVAAWLVACRLMVRRERAARTAPMRKRRTTLADQVVAEERRAETTAADTEPEAGGEPVAGGWDPVPITLPTYVAKAPAGRTVRTIDLDATGVWSSGRNASDSALAREAEEAARAAAKADAGEQRATGS